MRILLSLFLLAYCLPTVAAPFFPQNPRADEIEFDLLKRVSVVKMRVKGHPFPEYTNRTTRFDVGVGEKRTAGGLVCALLDPLSETYREMPWAPLDFYFDRPERPLMSSEVLGDPDVYFSDDDKNRNGKKDGSDKTIRVVEDFRELTFLDTKRRSSWAQFLIKFEKGDLLYKGLLRISVIPKKGSCEVEAWVCEKIAEKAGKSYCVDNKWTWKIDEIRVHAAPLNFLSGNFVSLLEIHVINSKKPYYRKLAEL